MADIFCCYIFYEWDMKFKASSNFICTLNWPQPASKVDNPLSFKSLDPVCMFMPANLEFLVLNGSYFQRVLGYLSSLIYAHIKLEFKCYVLTD